MKSLPTLGLVVNAPGIQERRAVALAPHLGRWFEVDLMVRPSVREFERSIRHWEIVYVIDPGACGFPAAAVAKGLQRTTVVEVGDPQRELYAAQDRRKWIQLVGGAMDGAVARYADGVVVRGEGLVASLKIRVPWLAVPDGVALEQFQSTGKGMEIRRDLSIPRDGLVVGVVGSIQWSAERSFAYGLDLIDAVAHSPCEALHVLIVGDGSGLARLRRRADDHGMHNVHFAGRVPHRDVPGYISAMDVCVSTQSRDAIGQARTTAKLPEYLACDRFVLATEVGTAAQILAPEMLLDSDFTRWEEHVGKLRARLEALVGEQPMLRAGAGTRALAIEHFSYPVLGRRLGEFLDRCARRLPRTARPRG